MRTPLALLLLALPGLSRAADCDTPALKFDAPRPFEQLCSDPKSAPNGAWGNKSCSAAYWEYAAKHGEAELQLSAAEIQEKWREGWTTQEKVGLLQGSVGAYQKDQAAFTKTHEAFQKAQKTCQTKDKRGFQDAVNAFVTENEKLDEASLERLGDLKRIPPLWKKTLQAWSGGQNALAAAEKFKENNAAKEKELREAALASGSKDAAGAKSAADSMFGEGSGRGNSGPEVPGAAARLSGDTGGGDQLAKGAAQADATQSKYGRNKEVPLPGGKGPAEKKDLTPGEQALEDARRREAGWQGFAKVPLVGKAANSKLAEARRDSLQIESSEAKSKWLKANAPGDAKLQGEYEAALKLSGPERAKALGDWQAKADKVMQESYTARSATTMEQRQKQLQDRTVLAGEELSVAIKDPAVPARVRDLAARKDLSAEEKKELGEALDKLPAYKTYNQKLEAVGKDGAALSKDAQALRERDPQFFAARDASGRYVQHNADHIADFKDGTKFRPEELGMQANPDGTKLPPGTLLTKDKLEGKSGLLGEGGGAKRFNSLDGSLMVDYRKDARSGQEALTRREYGEKSDLVQEFAPGAKPGALPVREAVLEPGSDRFIWQREREGGQERVFISPNHVKDVDFKQFGFEGDQARKYTEVQGRGWIANGEFDYLQIDPKNHTMVAKAKGAPQMVTLTQEKEPGTNRTFLREEYWMQHPGQEPELFSVSKYSPNMSTREFSMKMTDSKDGVPYYRSRLETMNPNGTMKQSFDWKVPEGVDNSPYTRWDGFKMAAADSAAMKYVVAPTGAVLGAAGRGVVRGVGSAGGMVVGGAEKLVGMQTAGDLTAFNAAVEGHRATPEKLRPEPTRAVRGYLDAYVGDEGNKDYIVREFRNKYVDSNVDSYAAGLRGMPAADADRMVRARRVAIERNTPTDRDRLVDDPNFAKYVLEEGGASASAQKQAFGHYGAKVSGFAISMGEGAAGGAVLGKTVQAMKFATPAGKAAAVEQKLAFLNKDVKALQFMDEGKIGAVKSFVTGDVMAGSTGLGKGQVSTIGRTFNGARSATSTAKDAYDVADMTGEIINTGGADGVGGLAEKVGTKTFSTVMKRWDKSRQAAAKESAGPEKGLVADAVIKPAAAAPPPAPRAPASARTLAIDPKVETDVRALDLSLTSGKGLKQGTVVKAESGEFYRGVSPSELKRIAAQDGLVPKVYSPDYKPKPGESASLTEAIKKEGAGWTLLGHTQGDTRYLTSVTSDQKVASVHAGSTGAVLRIKTDAAYSTEQFSRFSKQGDPTSKLPEAERVVPGVIDSRNVEIFDKGSNRWLPAQSPEGRTLIDSLAK